ncbi:hypothetical protein N9B34_02770 [Akkermansiaceae bacterium]|nr:hypothetical protein [Akkermansiaceae bacterium]
MKSFTAKYVISFAPILIGASASLVLFQFFARSERTNFDDIALGEETTNIIPIVDGHPIHGFYFGGDNSIETCLESLTKRHKDSVVLWLGNSQLHSVNQAGAGAEPASAKLFRSLHGRLPPLLTMSQPNANLQEHYILFEYLRTYLDIDALLLPVVFDDLRETGIRSDLRKALWDPKSNASISATNVGLNILNTTRDAGDFNNKQNKSDEISSSFQESSEEYLNGWLEQRSALWAARPEFRGRIMDGLYRFRNKVFRITPQSKRRQIPGRYTLNMQALEVLLKVAQDKMIPVITYIVPIRNDVQIPYEISEYVRFKEQVAILASETGATFVNLEDLIPSEFWGSTASITGGEGKDLDFMHFQEEGHELLAKALEAVLLKLIGTETSVTK